MKLNLLSFDSDAKTSKGNAFGWFTRMKNHSAVTIGKVNGWCFGGGPNVGEREANASVVVKTFEPAAGEKLALRQRDVVLSWHSIECRINAEDPYKFTPSPGRITSLHMPGGPGIRVDSHAYSGYNVPSNYDSLIGKIIAYGDTREQAIARLSIALSETVIEGIKTNIPLHQDLLRDAAFLRGGTSIHYLEEKLAKLVKAV